MKKQIVCNISHVASEQWSTERMQAFKDYEMIDLVIAKKSLLACIADYEVENVAAHWANYIMSNVPEGTLLYVNGLEDYFAFCLLTELKQKNARLLSYINNEIVVH
jgi:hypothetical protein